MCEFMWRTVLHILINKSEYERAEKVYDDWLFAGPVFVIINLHMSKELLG